MDKTTIDNAIKHLDDLAKSGAMDLIIVGSCAYSGVLEECGGACLDDSSDLDCVFVYRGGHPPGISFMVSKGLLDCFAEYKQSLGIDLFSTKNNIGGVKISADFISFPYLEQLAHEAYDGVSCFRKKLTDAVEVPDNDYYTFSGEKYIYTKPVASICGMNVYTLPTKLYVNKSFYPGVLLNKFIHYPFMGYVRNNETKGLCACIFEGFMRHAVKSCEGQKHLKAQNAMKNYSRFCVNAKGKIESWGERNV